MPGETKHRPGASRWRAVGALTGAAVLAVSATALTATSASAEGHEDPTTVRFATYNTTLNSGDVGGQLVDVLPGGANTHAQSIAEVIQINRPDILLVNEFDYEPTGVAADSFQDEYLEVSQGGQEPITYPYRYTNTVNTGVLSDHDFDRSGGPPALPGDAYGFGFHPGQFGMMVLSKYPIDADSARTFQNFLWKDMPGALLPSDPATPEEGDYYTPEMLEDFRLSSKSHWDLPITVNDTTIHFLVSHPTPPAFDGPEQRNKKRNNDEIRFWADYVTPANAGYIYDDDGATGGLPAGEAFVIAGDLNTDPNDGDGIPGAINQILDLPMVTDLLPSSPGGPEQSALAGGINDSHISDPAHDTGDFGDPPGKLRIDYVLPGNLEALASEVFWPLQADPIYPIVTVTDHRMVTLDVAVPAAEGPPPQLPDTGASTGLTALAAVAVTGAGVAILWSVRRREV